MILPQGLENCLFQQIQDCTHISLSIPVTTVSAPALSLPRAEVPRSLEDQGGSAFPRHFSSLGSSKVWSVSRATAWPRTNWLSRGQWKAQECGLRVKDTQEFSSRTLPPLAMVKDSLCLYSQKCLDCFNWNFHTKINPETTLATSKFSTSE